MEHIHKNFARLAAFLKRQDGAVTVDWVVLTAALIIFSIAAVITIMSSMPNIAEQIGYAGASVGIGN